MTIHQVIMPMPALYPFALHAAHIAQSLFYSFIQHTWAHDLRNIRVVRDQDDDLVAVEAIIGPGEIFGPGSSETVCPRRAGGWLVDFPAAALEGEDVRVKNAVLADRNSVWAFVFMLVAVGVLFEDLVKDVNTDIKEITHYLPPHIQPLVHHRSRQGFSPISRRDQVYPDSELDRCIKGIYAITLKDGMQVVLDLAGAQYNMPHITLMPLSAYFARWGTAICYQVPFRAHYDKHMQSLSGYTCITQLTIVMEHASFLNTLIAHGEKLLGVKVKELLTLDPEAFAENMAQYMTRIDKHLSDCCVELDNNEMPPQHYAHPSRKPFSLRYPSLAPGPRKDQGPWSNSEMPESLMFDIGSMQVFKWDIFRKMIQMSGREVKYREKKWAKMLLSQRCAYKFPGDWRVVFTGEMLPSSEVPEKCVSENPYFKQRKTHDLLI